MSLQTIALYLPQFHPIPENDAWWGKGFTEWTNVAAAKPQFRTHYQPHYPADLGYYDLRVPESRVAQANLAKQYHVDGFCYYHYWFGGKRLLERPFNEVLESGSPNFPFCLCWANEVWSRRWLGEERNILMPQNYSDEDDRLHAAWLAKAFADHRYIRAGERPLFLIYRPKDHPSLPRFVQRMKEAAHALGLADPFIVGVDAHAAGFDFRTLGLDGNLGFEPQLSVSGIGVFSEKPSFSKLRRNVELGIYNPSLQVFDDKVCRVNMRAIERPENTIPSCYVSWDNTARRGKNAIIYVNGTPETFGEELAIRYKWAKRLPVSQQFVFINAWNEWAEGNHLEPDQKFGHGYLEQLKLVAEKMK